MTLMAWLRVGVQRTLEAVIDELVPLAAAGVVGLVAARSVVVGLIAAVVGGLVTLDALSANRVSLLRESSSVGRVRLVYDDSGDGAAVHRV
jgi:hypothetical protein